MKQYYLLQADGSRKGPVGESSLRDDYYKGLLASQTFVWCEGMGSWQTLSQIFGVIPPPPMPNTSIMPPPPPPFTEGSNTAVPMPEHKSHETKRESGDEYCVYNSKTDIIDATKVIMAGVAIPIKSIESVKFEKGIIPAPSNDGIAFISIIIGIVFIVIIGALTGPKFAWMGGYAGYQAYMIMKKTAQDVLTVTWIADSGKTNKISLRYPTSEKEADSWLYGFGEKIKSATGKVTK